MRKRCFAAAIIFLLLVAQSFAADDQVKKIATAVDGHYNSLQTFKADFVETYSGNGVARKESGALLLKRPGRMRWDYREPSQKLFVCDGKTAIFYVPGERQARKAAVKKLDDFRSPLRYLLGKIKLEKEFDKLSIADTASAKMAGNVILSGVPKYMADRVSRVLLEITPQSEIQRIVIEEVGGAVTEFTFTNMMENVSLSDSLFHFSPPRGVETIEATDLSGG